MKTATQLGRVIHETPTGPLFHIKPFETCAGLLKLLKIRKAYEDRPEKGDTDFTIENFEEFKTTYLKKPYFKLIQRPNFEMIELDDDSDVLVYFSNPPLDKQLGLK